MRVWQYLFVSCRPWKMVMATMTSLQSWKPCIRTGWSKRCIRRGWSSMTAPGRCYACLLSTVLLYRATDAAQPSHVFLEPEPETCHGLQATLLRSEPETCQGLQLVCYHNRTMQNIRHSGKHNRERTPLIWPQRMLHSVKLRSLQRYGAEIACSQGAARCEHSLHSRRAEQLVMAMRVQKQATYHAGSHPRPAAASRSQGASSHACRRMLTARAGNPRRPTQ